MRDIFLKFPSTPYLALLETINLRDDKLMLEDEREEFLQHELTVEEKIDGANLGISFDTSGNLRLQNRGTYLQKPHEGQWKNLSSWLHPRMDILFESLTDHYILFGEWCYARHSVFYDYLPDWFLGFDVYDKAKGKFLSCFRRDFFLESLEFAVVPYVAQGRFTLETLIPFLSQSAYGTSNAEGLYLRWDEGGWLKKRAKLVRPQFTQSIAEHWSKSALQKNKLRVVY